VLPPGQRYVLLINARRSSVVSLMRHLKKLGLASALALVATCGLVGSASATLIEPGGTAFTLTSTNSTLTIIGSGNVSCTNATISGTTPAVGTAATWKTIPSTTLAYSGCMAIGFFAASVTASGSCPVLHAMGITATSALAVVTLPSGCSIDIALPGIGCTMTIAGPQTIGNGTAGTGGINWTNAVTSVAHLNAATVPSVVSNGVGFGCPTAGAHTGALSGTYVRSSSTNLIVTP
jgi:hypothetical protein